jgi:hypothetical protein
MAMTAQPTEPEPSQEFAAEPGARAIPLGLGGLAAGIANIAGLTVTVDGVPDAARLSAGHFLGDGSWSVRPAELQGLALRPSPGRNRNCRLSVRLRKIDKDMGDAFSIGGSTSTSMAMPEVPPSPAPTARSRCGARARPKRTLRPRRRRRP